MKQTSFFKAPLLFHGGELGHKKRKVLRPLCSKRPIHLTLKAQKNILYAKRSFIEQEVRRFTGKFQLRVYSIAVNNDHLHVILKISSRKNYRAFIRALTSQLAKKLGKGIWKLLPFTRVATWGKDFKKLLHYLAQNRAEVRGQQKYSPRKNWYQRYAYPS